MQSPLFSFPSPSAAQQQQQQPQFSPFGSPHSTAWSGAQPASAAPAPSPASLHAHLAQPPWAPSPASAVLAQASPLSPTFPAATAAGVDDFSDVNLSGSSSSSPPPASSGQGGVQHRGGGHSANGGAGAAGASESVGASGKAGANAAAAVRPVALSAGEESPRSVAEFLRQLFTPRLVTVLLALWLVLALLSVPFLMWRAESLVPVAPPSPWPQADDALFCRTPNEQNYPHTHQHLLPVWQRACIPCPTLGRCDDGRLRCKGDSMRVWRDCVPRNAENERALSMKEAAVTGLQLHAGAIDCSTDPSSAGGLSSVTKSDLTAEEMRTLVRVDLQRRGGGASAMDLATTEGRAEEERAWAIAARWLTQEAVHLSQFQPAARSVRMLYIHNASRQMPRFRAVYPQRSLSCRLTRTLWSHFFVAVGLGLLGVLVLSGSLLAHQVGQFLVQSRALEQRLLELLQADSYFDYDRRGRVHQPQAVAPLRAAHMARARARLGARPWALRRELDGLLQRCVWARAQGAIERHADVEVAASDFQYGRAPSWRWTGPLSAAAQREDAAASGNSSGARAAPQVPLSASRRPQVNQRPHNEDDEANLRHLHAL